MANWVLCGSYALYLQGLLHRKPKDLDIKYNNRNLTKFLHKILSVDECLREFCPYNTIYKKGWKLNIENPEYTLFYKYVYMKKFQKVNYFKYYKHKFDLINVFHNLQDSAEEMLLKIYNIDPEQINLDELKKLMQRGVSNKKEIVFDPTKTQLTIENMKKIEICSE